MTSDRTLIFANIVEERWRQNAKFPKQHELLAAGDIDPGLMLAILMEEVGEVAKAMLENDEETWYAEVRNELIQVAAVAVAWIEGIDAHVG